MNDLYTKAYLETLNSFSKRIILQEDTKVTEQKIFVAKVNNDEQLKSMLEGCTQVTDKNSIDKAVLQVLEENKNDKFAIVKFGDIIYLNSNGKIFSKEYKDEDKSKVTQDQKKTTEAQQTQAEVNGKKEQKPAEGKNQKVEQVQQVDENGNIIKKASQDDLKDYLVPDEEKAILSGTLKLAGQKKTFDQLIHTFDQYDNKETIQSVLITIKKDDIIYDFSPQHCQVIKKPDAPSHVIRKLEEQKDGKKNILFQVIGIIPKQLQALMDSFRTRGFQLGAERTAAKAEQAAKNGEKAPENRDKALQAELAKTPAFQKSVKKLKLKDQEQEDNYLGIFAKLFALLFGGPKKKYKEYSDDQLMKFARWTQSAVKNGSILPGKYNIKFRG